MWGYGLDRCMGYRGMGYGGMGMDWIGGWAKGAMGEFGKLRL